MQIEKFMVTYDPMKTNDFKNIFRWFRTKQNFALVKEVSTLVFGLKLGIG